jgi:hypothetical protein
MRNRKGAIRRIRIGGRSLGNWVMFGLPSPYAIARRAVRETLKRFMR